MEKGGAERVVAILANELSSKNQVSVLTIKNNLGEDAYQLNPKIKRLFVDKSDYRKDDLISKRARKLSPGRIFRLKKIILLEKPDIIISFLPEPSLRLMFISKFSRKMRRIPKIISIRNDPAREYKNPVLKFAVKVLYKNVDGMVYQTEDAKRFFKNIIKIKNQVVILNPIDSKALVKPKADAERKDIIVTVGRLEAQKNHEMLIRAFSKTLDVGHNFIVRIYGEGSRRDALQELIDELGLYDRVFLEGQVDNVIQKINEAKVFVLSSYYEGMPNALIEAMAMGLPCIAADCPCGGPRALIKNGENGILIRNNNEEDLTKELRRLMNNEKEREKISRKAILVREKNATDKIIQQWMKLISIVMGGK